MKLSATRAVLATVPCLLAAPASSQTSAIDPGDLLVGVRPTPFVTGGASEIYRIAANDTNATATLLGRGFDEFVDLEYHPATDLLLLFSQDGTVRAYDPDDLLLLQPDNTTSNLPILSVDSLGLGTGYDVVDVYRDRFGCIYALLDDPASTDIRIHRLDVGRSQDGSNVRILASPTPVTADFSGQSCLPVRSLAVDATGNVILGAGDDTTNPGCIYLGSVHGGTLGQVQVSLGGILTATQAVEFDPATGNPIAAGENLLGFSNMSCPTGPETVDQGQGIVDVRAREVAPSELLIALNNTGSGLVKRVDACDSTLESTVATVAQGQIVSFTQIYTDDWFGCACRTSSNSFLRPLHTQPVAGQTWTLALTGGVPFAAGFLQAGFSSTQSSLPGLSLPFDLGPVGSPGCVLLQSGELSSPVFTFMGLGDAVQMIPIPPTFMGQRIYVQPFSLDLSGSQLFSGTSIGVVIQ